MRWIREIGKWILCLLMAACTAAALLCLPDWQGQADGVAGIWENCGAMLEGRMALLIGLWIGLSGLYRLWIFGYAFQGRAAALSAVYTVFLAIGWLTERADRLIIFLMENENVFLMLFLMAGAWPGLYALVSRVDRYMDREKQTIEQTETRWPVLKGAACLFLCWVPYFIVCFPGSVEADFGTAILSFYGEIPFSSKMPLLETLLFGGTVRMFELWGVPTLGIALYNLGQILILAILLSAILKQMQKNGVSGDCVMAITFVYALVPIFPLYAMMVSKDTLFTLCILAAMLPLGQAILEKEKAFGSIWRYAALGAALTLVGLSRNAGIYLALVMAGATLLACRAKWKPLMATFLASGVLLGMWYGPVAAWWNVQPGGTLENMSMMLQQTARYARDYGEDVKDWEKTAISQVIRYEEAARIYDPLISDPVKNSLDASVTSKQKSAYIRAWGSQMLRHPDAYLEAALHMTSAYLSPGVQCQKKDWIQIGFMRSARNALEEVSVSIRVPFESPIRWMREEVKRTADASAQPLYTRAGTYMWIVMYLIHAVLRKRKYRQGLWLIPLVVVSVSCLFTPVNGYLRYLLPVIYLLPAAWLMCVEMPEKKSACVCGES